MRVMRRETCIWESAPQRSGPLLAAAHARQTQGLPPTRAGVVLNTPARIRTPCWLSPSSASSRSSAVTGNDHGSVLADLASIGCDDTSDRREEARWQSRSGCAGSLSRRGRSSSGSCDGAAPASLPRRAHPRPSERPLPARTLLTNTAPASSTPSSASRMPSSPCAACSDAPGPPTLGRPPHPRPDPVPVRASTKRS